MANQHTILPRRQRILSFVVANPDCSSRDVADAFGMNSKHIGSELEQLARWGYLVGVKSGNRMYWSATGKTPQEYMKGEVPRQIVTRSWQASATRHWLDVAFFGAAA